ncbi:MAG: class I SAM-dependent methyltransferase [Opitutaceae bacterium]|nr:class I SAM-dependent methyltransferase [Opitutaceae bacterium]
MNRPRRSFDRLATHYRALELLAFGRDLERARFAHLPRLADCRRILVLGEGDGRCLAQLVRLAPRAQIDCLDLSAAMLTRAADRLDPAARERVRFQQADLLCVNPPGGPYDAVITLFLLDCFTPPQVAMLVERIVARLEPGALWLWADFVLPAHGPARWRAQIWVAVLYAFFRWQTGVAVHALPPGEALLTAAGCQAEVSRNFQFGLLRTTLFRYRPTPI